MTSNIHVYRMYLIAFLIYILLLCIYMIFLHKVFTSHSIYLCFCYSCGTAWKDRRSFPPALKEAKRSAIIVHMCVHIHQCMYEHIQVIEYVCVHVYTRITHVVLCMHVSIA